MPRLGMTVRKPQWWKHLREWKAVYWKRQRAVDKQELYNDVHGMPAGDDEHDQDHERASGDDVPGV